MNAHPAVDAETVDLRGRLRAALPHHTFAPEAAEAPRELADAEAWLQLAAAEMTDLWPAIRAHQEATAYAKQVCAWIYGAPDVGQHNYLVRNSLGPNRAERRHPLGAV